MTDSVVSLNGGAVPQRREPVQSVIAEAERILEMARAGEIQGVGFVLLRSNGLCEYSYSGFVGSYSLVGAAHVLTDFLVDEARRDEE